MTATTKPKDAIVKAAADLFRKQGYAATGLSEIVASSGAPKGSLYHYFPGGKAEIGAAAVELAGTAVTGVLDRLAATSSSGADLIERYGAQLAKWMTASGFRDGCPIATTLLEVAADDVRTAVAGATAFAAWSAIIERMLVDDGFDEARARRLGTTAIAAIEGALLQSRVSRSVTPIVEVCVEMTLLLKSRSG